jgi:hypothetical protein
MRFLAFLSVLGSFAFIGCAGDTSVRMSVWDDSGVSAVGGTSGAGGAGGVSGQPMTGGSSGSVSSIIVTGGTRDLATTRCITGTCPFPSSSLSCLKANCAADIATCYTSDGVSRAASGFCMAYANCMLACPCNASSSKCESDCLLNEASTAPDCLTKLNNLYNCSNNSGCTPTTCATSGST